ncbi:unnamed protein product [Larinioides sclopetarius]|uniref:Uncharacterized protein n=1 Tax=Larinioides sclopetarius TaxID=280406 RepID=A0AAV2ACY2_9ARAC
MLGWPGLYQRVCPLVLTIVFNNAEMVGLSNFIARHTVEKEALSCPPSWLESCNARPHCNNPDQPNPLKPPVLPSKDL